MAIDPVAISVFGINIYWYGLVYAIGFLLSYFFIQYFAKLEKIKKDDIEDIFFYFIILSVIGGRLFHIIFYNFSYYLENPIKILAVWEGGMSIHGGFLFGFLVLFYFSKKKRISLLKLTDIFSVPAALGLAFGRLANFVNQELVGKITNSSLGVIFPNYDDNTRWPTTIFEGFKNLITFNILFFILIYKKTKPGIITAWFLILYSFPRFVIDFLREPEVFILFISMSQLLSLISGFIGIYLLYYLRKN